MKSTKFRMTDMFKWIRRYRISGLTEIRQQRGIRWMGHMTDGLLPIIDGWSLDKDEFKSHKCKVDGYQSYVAPTWF